MSLFPPSRSGALAAIPGIRDPGDMDVAEHSLGSNPSPWDRARAPHREGGDRDTALSYDLAVTNVGVATHRRVFC